MGEREAAQRTFLGRMTSAIDPGRLIAPRDRSPRVDPAPPEHGSMPDRDQAPQSQKHLINWRMGGRGSCAPSRIPVARNRCSNLHHGRVGARPVLSWVPRGTGRRGQVGRLRRRAAYAICAALAVLAGICGRVHVLSPRRGRSSKPSGRRRVCGFHLGTPNGRTRRRDDGHARDPRRADG